LFIPSTDDASWFENMRSAAFFTYLSVASAALTVDLDSPGEFSLQPPAAGGSFPALRHRLTVGRFFLRIASIKKAAKVVAAELLAYYHGDEPGHTPGILPGPPPDGDYYWWQGGAMWGTMIDYWHFTGDTTYNDMTTYAMIFQAGAPQNCYMPPNWTASLGNDDQGFWGMSAMLAAETKYPDPPEKDPQWLALAQAVFNTQAAPDRHDETCGGGLRWQIPFANVGYDYKNTIANGIFFNMGARLARYTKNNTYTDWAEKTYDWIVGVGFMDDKYNIYDGGHVDKNCTDVYKAQFSYNAAVMMQGAAFMYNYVGSASDPLGLTLLYRQDLCMANQATPLPRQTGLQSGKRDLPASSTALSRSSFPLAPPSRSPASSRTASPARRTCCHSRATCTAGWPAPRSSRPSPATPSFPCSASRPPPPSSPARGGPRGRRADSAGTRAPTTASRVPGSR